MKTYKDLREKSVSLGEAKDCAVIALSVACDVPYEDAHAALELAGRQPRGSSKLSMFPVALDLLGYEWVPVKNQFKSKTVRTLEREIKTLGITQPLLVRVRNHVLTIKDGKVHDWSEGRCHRVLDITTVRKK